MELLVNYFFELILLSIHQELNEQLYNNLFQKDFLVEVKEAVRNNGGAGGFGNGSFTNGGFGNTGFGKDFGNGGFHEFHFEGSDEDMDDILKNLFGHGTRGFGHEKSGGRHFSRDFNNYNDDERTRFLAEILSSINKENYSDEESLRVSEDNNVEDDGLYKLNLLTRKNDKFNLLTLH